MPTAYTAKLHEGEPVTFPEFALTCARAFMPLVDMKEAPPDAPIPEEIPPDPRYRERMEQARARLAEVEGWTAEQAEAEATWAQSEAAATIEQSNTGTRAYRDRLQAMLTRAQAWQPPTPDHETLKQFMVSQLTEAIDDCHEFDVPAAGIPGAAYREEMLTWARETAEQAERNWAGETERAAYRTQWLRALRASLPTEEADRG